LTINYMNEGKNRIIPGNGAKQVRNTIQSIGPTTARANQW